MISFLRSVKFRLTLWYALILTVFLSLFALVMRSELSRVLHRDADLMLEKQAVTLGNSLESYWTSIPEERRQRDLHLFETDFFKDDKARLETAARIKDWEKSEQHLGRSNLVIRILFLDKSIVISNLKGWEREMIFPDFERDSLFMEQGSSYQTVHFREQPVRLYYAMFKISGRPAFVIQTGYPLHEIESTLTRLDVIMALWIPFAVLAAGVAGWFLARRFLLPIDVMIEKARPITAAHLKTRLPRSGTGDELDRLAATLNEMMDRIALSTSTVQAFSADVSHELKTPLAIIRGEIDLALRKKRSPEDLVKTLRVIEEEVNGLIRLVDDLLLLMRSDSNQLRFEKKLLSLGEILEYVVRRFQDRAREKGISLGLSGALEIGLEGDEVYLKRLFSNLVDNAIKFTPEKGWVRITAEPAKGRLCVRVSDSGMGIEEDMIEKVFSRFYRTNQARTHEGAGLGLAIARAICTAHHGTLRLESRPQQGAVAIVELPSRL